MNSWELKCGFWESLHSHELETGNDSTELAEVLKIEISQGKRLRVTFILYYCEL